MSDSILPIPAIPPGLQEAAARGVLIPFVGAGASVLAGCPSWAKLADGALTQCIRANKFSYDQLAQIEHLSPRIKLSIAQGLEAEHQFKLNYDNLINPVVGYDSNEIGHRVYRSLSRLGETFVTTNYDAWLDIDIPDVKISTSPVDKVQTTAATRPMKRRAIYRVNEFTPANLNQPRTVFHLHGSLAEPKGMVVTTRDYITRYANDRADTDPELENRTLTFLSHLFSTKTVLFVGYSLEDLEILEYVIQKARVPSPEGKPEARHFMLQGFFSHQMELMRSLSSYYQQFDIQLLPFQRDKKDWHQLIDVLEHFSEAMPARSPLNLQKQAEMEALLD